MNQGLAERSGLDVAPTLRRYILKLEDASDRVIFKEAYARASRYNQTVYDDRNGDESIGSESTENADDGSSTEGGEEDYESEDSIDRRLAGIGESQANNLFDMNRRIP